MSDQPGATERSIQDATRLRVALTRLARQLRTRSAVDVSPSQISALTRLDQCGPLRLGALAEAEGTSAPTASRLVDILEERGLVERVADPLDGRASVIGLTRQGRLLLEDMRERSTQVLRTGLDELSTAERTLLRDALPVLEVLVERLQRPRSAAPDGPKPK
jgi:DNA-binding MarR family transcriptional regulator